MKTIYIVTNGTYSDYSIGAVFSDREKAEVYLAEVKKIDDDEAKIEEWPVDEQDEKIARQYWVSFIDPISGEIEHNNPLYFPGPRYQWATPNQKTGRCDNINDFPYSTGYIPNQITFTSFISQEHADKLAIEARQEFIRKIDLNLVEDRMKIYPVKDSKSHSYYYNHPDYTG